MLPEMQMDLPQPLLLGREHGEGGAASGWAAWSFCVWGLGPARVSFQSGKLDFPACPATMSGPMAMGPQPSTLDPGKGSRDRGWTEVGAREMRQVPARACFLREQKHETLFQSSQHTSP